MGRMDDIAELYRRMGLRPLDDFLWQESKGVKGMRGIGTSTFMAAHAALSLDEGKSVSFLSYDTIEISRQHAALTTTFLRAFDGPTARINRPDRVTLSNGCHIHVVGREPFKPANWNPPAEGLTYEEAAWRKRLERRLGGPFEMVQSIRLVEGDWVAFAEDDEELMPLPEDSVRALHARKIPLVNGTLPPKEAFNKASVWHSTDVGDLNSFLEEALNTRK